MVTKFDTNNYNYECSNCDDVFLDKEEAQKHIEEHREAFKEAGKDIPVGVWECF